MDFLIAGSKVATPKELTVSIQTLDSGSRTECERRHGKGYLR
nr:MAG TPA: protein of unknown function (DUF3903) [Caudoviricetes sp.]